MASIIYNLILATTCECVKVDMEGTLSLGKDVIQTISRFLGEGYLPVNPRRSLTPIQEDKITEMVKMTMLCRELDLCQSELRKFIDEYVTIQAKGIENILSTLLGENFNTDIYEMHLNHNLGYIRLILKEENAKVSDNNISEIWINTMKKISAKFQEMTKVFVSELLQIDKKNIDKKLNQKLILATVIIEMKYIYKLCAVNNICVDRYECSVGLNTVLEHLKTIGDDKVRLFIKYVYEALYETPFYGYLSETTAHEFQVILNDMAYSSNVPAKELLSIVQKVVAARIDFVTANRNEKISHDGLLSHVILSDMDNIFSSRSNPFGEFLSHFFLWIVRGETYNVSKHIRRVFNEIGKEMSIVSNDLFYKLSSEVRVFLEITVDPE